MDTSTDFIVSFTFHVKCDTEGATIHYTLDGTDPSEEGGIEVAAGDPVFVHRIGTVTIRAVGTKEGMADSEEITKTATVQARERERERERACYRTRFVVAPLLG